MYGGFMLEQSYYDCADRIIDLYGARQEKLIPIIQDIQNEYRYLPPELLSYVAEKIGITEAKHLVWRHFMRIFPLIQRENM